MPWCLCRGRPPVEKEAPQQLPPQDEGPRPPRGPSRALLNSRPVMVEEFSLTAGPGLGGQASSTPSRYSSTGASNDDFFSVAGASDRLSFSSCRSRMSFAQSPRSGPLEQELLDRQLSHMSAPDEHPHGHHHGRGHHHEGHQQHQQHGHHNGHAAPHSKQLGVPARASAAGSGPVVMVEAVAAGAGGDDGQPSLAAAAERARQAGASKTPKELVDRVLHVLQAEGHTCKACKALLQYCNDKGSQVESLREHFDSSQHAGVEKVLHTAAAVQAIVKEVESDTGWQVISTKPFKLMYSHHPGSTVHNFKARCVLDAPVEQPLSLAREFDLTKTWHKYCEESVILKKCSPSDFLVYGQLWMPWPFSSISFVGSATGVDLLREHDCVFVTIESPGKGQMPPEVELPSQHARNRKMQLLRGSCLKFVPLAPAAPGGPQRCLCTMQLLCETGIKYVPQAVLSFVLRILAPFVYDVVVELLRKNFKDPSSALPRRIAEQPDFYGLLRRRVDQHLEAKQRSQASQPSPL